MKNKLHYYGDISTVWLFYKPIRIPRTVMLWKERLGDHKSNLNV